MADLTKQEVEQFFMACVISIGMIVEFDSREGDPKAQEFFRLREKLYRKRLPWSMSSPEHGISCDHPCSFDNYVEWCRDRCEEAKCDRGASP